jgi:hypothetical protein
MSTTPVQLDMSTAIPLQRPQNGVTLDMSTAQPIGGASTQSVGGLNLPAPPNPQLRQQASQAINSDEQSLSPTGLVSGLAKSAGQTVDFTSELIRKGLEAIRPGLGEKIIPQYTIDRAKQLDTPRVGERPAAMLESTGELFTGDELLGLVGGAAKGSEALKGAIDVAKVVENHPIIARMLRIGINTAKAAAETGGSTYVHTGGDPKAARNAALIGGGVGGAASALAEGGGALLANKPAEEATAGTKYAQTAQAAIRPHLEEIAKAAGEKIANFNVEDALARTGDYSGARENLAQQLNAVGAHLDAKTGGQYTQLREEITEARTAAWRGGPREGAIYAGKQREMFDLLQKANINPELRSAVQGGWQKYYAVGDVAKGFDSALNGIPGGSAASMEQMGIKGRTLQTSLNTAVRLNGRETVTAALGGPERLEALEEIARKNITNAQRAEFNRAVRFIATSLPAAAGAKAGWEMTGNYVGAAIGAGVGRTAANLGIDATLNATGRVFQAIKTNPKIAQHLIFAIDSGARPEVYGPMIGSMIQQWELQRGRPEQAPEPADGGGGQ